MVEKSKNLKNISDLSSVQSFDSHSVDKGGKEDPIFKKATRM